MIRNYGKYKVSCEIQKDQVYLGESIVMNATVDSSAAKKPVEKITARLLRRIQVFNLELKESFFARDEILFEEEQEANSGANQASGKIKDV